MKILITGGAGFIGSHLANAYLQKGWSVRVLDSLQSRVHPEGVAKYVSKEVEFIRGDVTCAEDWKKALEGVDVVSHQAAYQDYVPDYSQFSTINVVGTAMLFEVIAAQKLPVQQVIVASSQAVYGEGQFRCTEHGRILPKARSLEQLTRRQWEVRCPHCDQPMTPELLDEAYPNPLSPYGTSKYAEEITALKLGALLDIPCVGLRYSITQGPQQSLFNQYSGIARIFTLKLKRDEPPVAFEDGMLQRDYVHVKDVAAANLLVTQNPRASGVAFNVGSGIPTTVVEYGRRLAAKMGKNIDPVIPGIFRQGDARHSVSSTARLRALGWQPQRGLDDILEDFTAWVDTLGNLERFVSNAEPELLRMNVLRLSHAA